MKKIIIAQFIILLIGTIFAWTNFFIELASWLKGGVCTTGCAAGVTNPFLTPCFYGALFFLTAFILSTLIITKANNK
jgi:hypothetical protein